MLLTSASVATLGVTADKGYVYSEVSRYDANPNSFLLTVLIIKMLNVCAVRINLSLKMLFRADLKTKHHDIA